MQTAWSENENIPSSGGLSSCSPFTGHLSGRKSPSSHVPRLVHRGDCDALLAQRPSVKDRFPNIESHARIVWNRVKLFGGFHKWGTPKSSIYRWFFFSLVNHPIYGTPHLHSSLSPFAANLDKPCKRGNWNRITAMKFRWHPWMPQPHLINKDVHLSVEQ